MTERADRADKILHAAARLFAERGYGATSIDDIGAAAGVSGPAIYWHFPGKKALLAAMLTDISERLLAGGREAVARATDPDSAIEALVRMQVNFALDHPDLIIVHARELRHLDRDQAHRVRALQRQYVDVWVDALQKRHRRVKRERLVGAGYLVDRVVHPRPLLPSPRPPEPTRDRLPSFGCKKKNKHENKQYDIQRQL